VYDEDTWRGTKLTGEAEEVFFCCGVKELAQRHRTVWCGHDSTGTREGGSSLVDGGDGRTAWKKRALIHVMRETSKTDLFADGEDLYLATVRNRGRRLWESLDLVQGRTRPRMLEKHYQAKGVC
jgi:hypothetical protein